MISISSTIMFMFPPVKTRQLMVTIRMVPASLHILYCSWFNDFIVDKQYPQYYRSVYILHPEKCMLFNPKVFLFLKQ